MVSAFVSFALENPLLFGFLLVQTLLASALFVLLGFAFLTRRSVPYLLVWLAAFTLVAESLIGLAGLTTSFNPMTHVLVDNALDILLVVSVFAAVHYARQLDRHDSTHDSV